MKTSRKFLSVMIIMTMIFFVPGCGKSKDIKVINGGELIYYAFCLEGNKEQLASCPIITTQKAENIVLNNVVLSDDSSVSFALSGVDMNDFVEHEGYYVYFPVLTIKADESSVVVDTSVEKIIFEIDGELVEYETPNFILKNTNYYVENKLCDQVGEDIYISGEYTAIYGYIPNVERPVEFTLESERKINLSSYRTLDYLLMNDLTIDGCAYDSQNINKMLETNVDVELKHSTIIENDVNTDGIIRSSQVLIYEIDGCTYIWTYTPGIYIWKNYDDYSNVIRFIDANR